LRFEVEQELHDLSAIAELLVFMNGATKSAALLSTCSCRQC